MRPAGATPGHAAARAPSEFGGRRERRGRPGDASSGLPALPRSGPFLAAATMLIAAILFGGGGTPAPVAELIVELVAIALLGAWPWISPRSGPAPGDRLLLAGAACLVAVPLVQLLPLPPAVWHALPGREVEIQALQLIGAQDSWRPLSVSPLRTLASLLSLLPPLAMLLFVARLSRQERSALLPLLALLGCASAFLGVLQLAAGGSDAFRLYAHTNVGFLNGFQANRNQEADVLLLAILAVGATAALRPAVLRATTGRWVTALTMLVLAAAVALTGSRAGTALLLVALIGIALLFGWHRTRRPVQIAVAGALLLAIAGGAVALRSNAMLERTWSRFAATGHGDGRTTDLWPDAVFALRQYWPAGSGVGTFVPVFEMNERLEVVDETAPNRAHNDYLEYAIEAGILSVPVILLLLFGTGARATSMLMHGESPETRVHALYALFALGVLGLHSIVDYPMRSMSLAVTAGMAVGLLSRVPREPYRS